jgi:hypothetical protein
VEPSPPKPLGHEPGPDTEFVGPPNRPGGEVRDRVRDLDYGVGRLAEGISMVVVLARVRGAVVIDGGRRLCVAVASMSAGG